MIVITIFYKILAIHLIVILNLNNFVTCKKIFITVSIRKLINEIDLKNSLNNKLFIIILNYWYITI